MTIFGYNQRDIIELGLSLNDLAIFEYLNERAFEMPGQPIKIDYQKIADELPVLSIGAKQVYRSICKLTDKNCLTRLKSSYRQGIYVLMDKNVLIKSLVGQKCPNKSSAYSNVDIINYNKNNNYNKNINLSLNNISITKEERDLWASNLPNKFIPTNAQKPKDMDFAKFFNFVQEIKDSRFLSERTFLDYSWCIKHYERILAGVFRDFEGKIKTSNSSSDDGYYQDAQGNWCKNGCYVHRYTKEELDSLFTNWDEVEI